MTRRLPYCPISLLPKERSFTLKETAFALFNTRLCIEVPEGNIQQLLKSQLECFQASFRRLIWTLEEMLRKLIGISKEDLQCNTRILQI